jgi:hypothetical protein
MFLHPTKKYPGCLMATPGKSDKKKPPTTQPRATSNATAKKPAAKAPAAKKRVAKTPTPPEPTHLSAQGLVDLLKVGAKLTCELADFDSLDKYHFTIQETGESVGFHWKMGSCPDNGTLRVGPEALHGAESVIFISQGNADEPEGRTPPFLVSRKTLERLKNSEGAPLSVNEASGVLRLGPSTRISLLVNGQPHVVDALTASDDDGDIALTVLDHATWPVLLKVEFDGDNYIELREITSG